MSTKKSIGKFNKPVNISEWDLSIADAQKRIKALRSSIKVWKKNRDAGNRWPGFEVSGNYQYVRFNPGNGASGINCQGGSGSFGAYLAPRVGVIADFARRKAEIDSQLKTVAAREKGALGEKLTHFAILIAARKWTQQVIWNLHDKNAVKSGLKPEILTALAEGRRPPGMAEDEDILYDFCIELQQNQSVSDRTYERMLSKFGEGGIGEATLIQGEYTIMSMFMNVARTPLDPGTPAPMKPFPR
jgi:4-carboxymuconolactone decarboxylase